MRSLVALLSVAALAGGCGAAAAPEREPFPQGAADNVADPATDVPLGTAVTWSVLREDEQLAAVVDRAFDSVTPENEMKLQFLQPERGEFAFDDADALVDWATEHGKQVRGHTLVWHQQVPEWLGEEDWSAAGLEQVLREHVRTVVSRYRGRVTTWDVVNEPFTSAGELRTAKGSPFLEVLGPRYIAIALQAAREADPDARLMVNEIGAELGGPKLDALVRMAQALKRERVPLDGIGLESHLTTERPPGRGVLRDTIERLAGLGLDVELTELDVVNPKRDDRRQAAIYADAAAACASVARCRRVTTWGVSDRDSWLGSGRRPLPFDSGLRAKPAWEALTRGLRR